MRKLIANKAMSFGGKSLKPGDPFDASHKHARVLVAIGKASDPPAAATAAPAAPAPPAAPIGQAESEEAAAPPDESPEAKAKRTYKRRDLKAE